MLAVRSHIKRIRKNIRDKHRKQCIGCNRHYHPGDFCLHEGLFGRIFLCFSCAQQAEEDFFVYEMTAHEILEDDGPYNWEDWDGIDWN